MSTVSVCIVTYNSEKYIKSCIQAVMKQTYSISTIIIVDNASVDESVAIIQEFIEQGAPIQLITNDFNNGFAGGQNQAINASNTDYVLVLNPDVELEPDYIKELVFHLEQNPQVGSATGLLMLKEDCSIVDSTGLDMPFNRHAVDRGAGQAVQLWLQPSEVFGVSGAAAFYSRKMIDAIKLEGQFFDEQFFAYKEDVDVAWRARLLGWSASYVPTAKALHARGWKKGGRHSISLFVRQHSYVNQLYMLIKNEQLNWTLIGRLPILIAREAAKLVYFILKERDMLGSWKLIIKAYPSIVKKRKLLHNMRRKQ